MGAGGRRVRRVVDLALVAVLALVVVLFFTGIVQERGLRLGAGGEGGSSRA